MKKDKVTDLVFVLDRSGSMAGLEKEVINGFNKIIEERRENEGKVKVTTVLFDNEPECIHKRVKIKEINDMTEKEYYPRGTTALLDAIGTAISYMSDVEEKLKEKGKKHKVLFIIQTDGLENASKKYDYYSIRKLIREKKENDKWNFLFLGANIDSISEAENLGISKSCACDFVANEEGLDVTYNALSDAVAGFCDLSSIDFSEAFGDEWKKSIEEFNELEDIVTKQMEESDFEETLE